MSYAAASGLPAEIEAFELLEAGADNEHVGIDRDDPLKARRQDFVEKQAAEDGAREAASAGEVGVEAGEVEGEELDAIAQSRRQIIEARRNIVRRADEKNLAPNARFGLDEGSNRAHRRRKKRAVRREAIGGSHAVSPYQRAWPRSLARQRSLSPSPARIKALLEVTGRGGRFQPQPN